MRIAIVEDDPLLLRSLEMLLSSEPGVNVVGAYESAEEALQSLRRDSPEIMLTDLGLPGLSGIDLIKIAKKDMPRLEIMVHTVFDETERMLSAIKAGATGYFLKGAGPRDLIEAVRGLHGGGATMSSKMAEKIIREFQDEADGPDSLTRIERAVVGRIAEGMTPGEISKKSGLSPHAVGACIKAVYEKVRRKDSSPPGSGYS